MLEMNYAYDYDYENDVVSSNYVGKLSTSSVESDGDRIWLYGEMYSSFSGDQPLEEDAEYSVRAENARNKCRRAYTTPNPIFEAAIAVKLAYTIGEKAGVGRFDDKLANKQVKSFLSKNEFSALIRDRLVAEMFIDGEIHWIFDKEFEQDLTEDVPPVPFGGIVNSHKVPKVVGNPIRGINEITVAQTPTRDEPNPSDQEYKLGDFASWTYKANFGELRGYPPFAGACQIADGMVEFINGRLRINNIQSRLNMLQTHLIWPKTERNKLTIPQQKSACVNNMLSIPDDGGIIHNFKDGETGHSEETSFLKTDKAAIDASSDFEILRRNFAAAMGLADHMLGWGDSTNRATADTISESVIKNFQLFQVSIKEFLTEIIRKMLVLANGADHEYTVLVSPDPDDMESEESVGDDPRNPPQESDETPDRTEEAIEPELIEIKVKANELPVEIILPDLQTDSLSEKIMLYKFAVDVGYSKTKVLQKLGLVNARTA